MTATWAMPDPIAPAPMTATGGTAFMAAILARGLSPGESGSLVPEVTDVTRARIPGPPRARYDHVMTTDVQTRPHPLVDKHQAVLDEAIDALATRRYYSRYPESPSPKVYGESAAADGLAAYQEHLGKPYAALAGQPTDGTDVGSEVSPYGPVLGVRYPRLDIDAALTAAKAAMPAWRDAGPRVRAAVCVEIIERINARSFEMANAVMHTSGQPFVMSFQAGGPHAQDRALEAVIAGLVEQERVPESVVLGEARAATRRCGCRRTTGSSRAASRWSSAATPSPRGTATRACSRRSRRATRSSSSRTREPSSPWPSPSRSPGRSCRRTVLTPALVQLAAEDDGEGLAKTLAERPEIAIIDYTGGPAFGGSR